MGAYDAKTRRAAWPNGGPVLNDPRVFFAAERTLLAWVRTGLTIMAFGFVVARFAVQSSVQPVPAATHTHDLTNIVGIVMVLLGVGCMVLGAAQHRSYVATLPPTDVPRSHSPIYPIGLAIVLALLGVALAVYLAI